MTGEPGRRRDVARLAAAVYLAGQALTLLVVGLVARAHGRSLADLLSSWDGQHLLHIAAHGYDPSTQAGVLGSVAFFPGYPALVSLMHAATPLTFVGSGIAVSVLSGLALAVGLARLFRTVRPDSGDGGGGLMLVALAATAPMAVVLAMTYSEALFCALAVWALVLMVERQWLPTAGAVIAAGTVRQTAIALCVALAVAVIAAARRGEAPVRAWVAAAAAPIGGLAYLAWADAHTGRRGSWFEAQRNGWGARFDGGRDTLRFAYHALIDAPSLLDVATVAALLAALGLLVALARLVGRRWPEVVAYAAVVFALDALSTGIMNSKIRLLVPALPLLIPVAHWLQTQPRGLRWTLLAAAALGGAYYSAYALVLYGFAI